MDAIMEHRVKFVVQHESLEDRQTLIQFDRCHNGVEGTVGWMGGWLTCWPHAHVVIDLLVPTLVTKLSVMNTNVLASPRAMELLYSTDGPDGPWEVAYILHRTQTNRMMLQVPPNTDTSDNESPSIESFYLLGHCTTDADPVWSTRFTSGFQEQDVDNMSSRGTVTYAGAAGDDALGVQYWPVARYWKVNILEANGLHYIGMNGLTLFGRPDPLPAPDDVKVTVAPTTPGVHGGAAAVLVSWLPVTPVSGGCVTGYKVVAYPGGRVGLGTGGFEQQGGIEPCSMVVGSLLPRSTYVFVVFAVDENGVEGAPSRVSRAVRIIDAAGTGAGADVGGDSSSSSAVDVEKEEGSWVLVDDPDDLTSVASVTAASDEWAGAADEEAAAAGDEVHGGPATEAGDGEGSEVHPSAAAVKRQKAAEKSELQKTIRAVRQGKGPTHRAQSAEDYALAFNLSLARLVRGCFDEAPNVKVATSVNMFLSSTFDDTSAERNYLMDTVYPMLQSYCNSLGLHFSVVDLRWGVRDDATDNHMTIDICLGELSRCLEQSTAASFVFLSTERYGWRALPNRVRASEFTLILSLVPDGEAKETLEQWYLRDDNSGGDPWHVLQRISAMKAKGDVKHNDFWGGAQGVMQEAVRTALAAAAPDAVPEAVRRNWEISVTEREVRMGLTHQDDTEIHALVLMRTVEGLKEGVDKGDDKAGLYYTAPDMDRRLLNELRGLVKDGLASDPVTVAEYTVPWVAGGIQPATHMHQLRNVASEFFVTVQAQIERGLLKRRPLDDHEKEWVHHHQFAHKRAQAFCGRAELLDAIVALAARTDHPVKCAHGKSGAGKTSVMCAAAALTYRRLAPSDASGNNDDDDDDDDGGAGAGPVVIFRACGTSAASSHAKELLSSLCAQIALLYGEPPPKDCSKFEEQVAEFHRLLAVPTGDRPLVLFIDSLDQLTDKDFGRSQPWRWLPRASDAFMNASIVVSVLPDEVYGLLTALAGGLPPALVLEVPLMPQGEALALLDEWMQSSGRSLQPAQRASVEADLAAADAISMLHVRLVHDRVCKWHSYDPPEHLPATMVGLIHLIFDDLEMLHGVKLVSAVLGCLSASKHGLSVANLVDLVSCNDDVLGKKGEAGAVLQWHDAPVRRLPPLVFARLRNDLGDYLVERGENGVSCLNLYHRQFWETATGRYFAPATRAALHDALADYFSGQLDLRFPDRLVDPQPLFFHGGDASKDAHLMASSRGDAAAGARPDGAAAGAVGRPNRQRLCELPHAELRAGRYGQLSTYLCDLAVIEAYFCAGRAYAETLLVLYDETIRALNGPDRAASDGAAATAKATATATAATEEGPLKSFFLFVSRWFHALCMQPSLLPGLAANAPTSHPASAAAQALRASGLEQRRFLKWLNRPAAMDACVQSNVFTHRINTGALAPDAQAYAVAAVESHTVMVYDVLSSRLLAQFYGHADVVTGVCFAPAGGASAGPHKEVLSVSRDGTAAVWSTSDGEALRTLVTSHPWWLTCCVWPQPHLAAVGTANNAVLVLDPSAHAAPVLLHVLERHHGPVSSVCLLGSHALLTGSADGYTHMWDLGKGKGQGEVAHQVAVIHVNKPVNCVAAAPNGTMFAVASDHPTCDLWVVDPSSTKLQRSRILHQGQQQHKSEVWGCCFSPNSLELVTVGADRVCFLFNVWTGAVVGRLDGHSRWVSAVHWRGDVLLTVSADLSAKLWSRSHVLLPGADAAAVPEEPLMGMRVVVGDDGAMLLHAVSKAQALSVIDISDPLAPALVEQLPPPAGSEPQNAVAFLHPTDRAWAYASYGAEWSLVTHGILRSRACGCSVASKFAVWDPEGTRVVVAGDAAANTTVHYAADATPRLAPLASGGWAMDVAWTPDGASIVQACQTGTLLQDAMGHAPAAAVGPAAYLCAVSAAGDRVCLVLSDGGQGYGCHPVRAVIVRLGGGGGTGGEGEGAAEEQQGEEICLDDAFHTIKHCRDASHCRGLVWAQDDALVLVLTAASSAFACPVVSAYDTATGAAVSRFLCPLSLNFDFIDVRRGGGEGREEVYVLVDDTGKFYFLFME